MIKAARISIGLIIILLAVIFTASGLYLQNLARQQQNDLTAYYARRDDLMAQQLSLEAVIDELNSTLQAENLNQQELMNQLSDAEQAALAQQAAALTPPAPVMPTPAPRPRITRAS